MKKSKEIEHIAGGRGVIPFLFVFLFSFHLNAQSSKYDINDPRNPKCPCHKYQKLADEEYARLLKSGNKGNGELASSSAFRKDRIHKTRIEKYRKQKRKAKDKKRRTPRWVYKFKNFALWKKVTNPSRCPVWNDR